jgi:para-nitrobenzyl esterase
LFWGRKLGVATIVATTALATIVASSEASQRLVRTESGTVKGIEATDYRLFQGIPYAAPPVGEWRWKSPRPSKPWTGVRDATRPGARCTQLPSPQGNPGSSAEDCLFLNVTTPRAGHKRKPVVVFLHGGGFTEEAGSDYDARHMAVSGDVVVVTPNYRLGIFGMFTYPELAGSGGFTVEDQQAALRWVQRNIARFGGDPDKVTLAGESAGGKSICAHLASPAAAGLFDRVILQSAPCTGTVPAGAMFPGLPEFPQWMPTGQREQDGVRVAASLGCADLGCLRRLPAEDLLPELHQFMSPTFGSTVLPDDPGQAIATGRIHRVPAISGITRDEMSYLAILFYDLVGKPITAQQYQVLLADAFGADASRVAEQYPLTKFVSPSQAWAAVTTDTVFACPTAQRNSDFAARMPTWAYEFAEASPAMPGLTFPPGAPHGADLDYLFPVYGHIEPAKRALTDRMIGYWTEFAHNGQPGWPRYPATVALASTAGEPPLVDFTAGHRCGFWQSLRSAGKRPR